MKMDVRKEFAPTGANKGCAFVSGIGFLKLENAFKECALEVDYLLPECPEKEAALEYLLIAKKACTAPNVVVQVSPTVQAPVQVPTEPKEKSNVKEKNESKKVIVRKAKNA